MRAVRAQYFLAYAVTGSVWPFLSVYLQHQGLDKVQIGYTQAAGSVAAILSPVLVTLLADTRLDPRRILTALFLLSGAALLAFTGAHTFWPILLLWALQQLLFAPAFPLQDGVNFSLQQRRRENGELSVPYHRVRVFGTIGFMLPGLILFCLLRPGRLSVDAALLTGVAFLLLAGLNALRLPDSRAKRPPMHASVRARAGLPTLAAARTLLRRPLLPLCAAIFLVQMATASYYTFYPVYLVEKIGIGNQWLGLVMDVGVLGEIFFMLACGWLVQKLGVKRLLILGLLCTAARLALLAAIPNAAVAVGTQVFHGLMVLSVMVIPQVFLNRHASDHDRHSMQGLYTILVLGLPRILGNLLVGPIASHSLLAAFAWSAALCVLAAGLILVAFRDVLHPHPAPETSALPTPEPATALLAGAGSSR